MTVEKNHEQTLLTLSNAAQLGAQVILHTQGDKLGDHVGNERLTLDMARGMILSRIRARFKIRAGRANEAVNAQAPAQNVDPLNPTAAQ